MAKIMFMFPGQGAQKSGMGKELYDAFPKVREIYDNAAKYLDTCVDKLGFGLTDEELSRTINAQPAIYTMGYALSKLMTGKGIVPQGIAGFSLGEITALTAGGSVSEEDGYKLIASRAAAMQKAAETGDGAMYAIIGIGGSAVERICSQHDGVWAVNFNSPEQTVIAGRQKECEEVGAICIEAGAKRSIRLATAGAFHSPMMMAAATECRENVADIAFRIPKLPVYSNMGGIINGQNIPEYLERQMVSPVKWLDEVREIISDGFDTFIELGPGKTLCGLIGRIDKSVRVYSSDSAGALQNIFDELG